MHAPSNLYGIAAFQMNRRVIRPRTHPMKTTSLIVVAGMFAFAGLAQAEEAKQKPKKGPAPEILEKYDADRDGKLSKEEKAAWIKDQPKPEKKAKKEPKPLDPAILEKYDTNKDGKLSQEEKAVWNKDKKAEKANKPKPEKKAKPNKKKSENSNAADFGE